MILLFIEIFFSLIFFFNFLFLIICEINKPKINKWIISFNSKLKDHCIDSIFQKRLLHYRLPITQINLETSAMLFHKIFSKMNWPPFPVDVTFILSLCFISFSCIDINFKGKNVSHSDVEQTANNWPLKIKRITYKVFTYNFICCSFYHTIFPINHNNKIKRSLYWLHISKASASL